MNPATTSSDDESIMHKQALEEYLQSETLILRTEDDAHTEPSIDLRALTQKLTVEQIRKMHMYKILEEIEI